MNGDFAIDNKIISENELARKMHCSRQTAREALKELTYNGVLESHHGKGYFVKQNLSPDTLSPLGESLDISKTRVMICKDCKIDNFFLEKNNILRRALANKNNTCLIIETFIGNSTKPAFIKKTIINSEVISEVNDLSIVSKSFSTLLSQYGIVVSKIDEYSAFGRFDIFDKDQLQKLGWKDNEYYPIVLSITFSDNKWIKIDFKTFFKTNKFFYSSNNKIQD